MLQQIRRACFLLALIMVLLSIGLYQNASYLKLMSRGNYFFQATRDNINIKTLALEFSDGHITLEKRNDLWYIKEADDYFASFSQINLLFKLILQTTVYRADIIEEEKLANLKKDAFRIKTIDTNGQIVDEAFILPKKENMLFYYAALNTNQLLYQIKGDFNLSKNPMDWIQSPILSIKYSQIKTVHNKKFHVYRRFAAEDLMNSQNDKVVPQMLGWANNIWYLTATDVRHAVHFDRQKYKKTQSYEITTLGGLVYLLNVFSDGVEYWLNVDMKHEATVEAEDMRLYKETHTLYEGWFFKISPDIGQFLNNFTI